MAKICKNLLTAVIVVSGVTGVTTVSCVSLLTGHNHVIEAFGAITGLCTLGATAISHLMKDGTTGVKD